MATDVHVAAARGRGEFALSSRERWYHGMMTTMRKEGRAYIKEEASQNKTGDVEVARTINRITEVQVRSKKIHS